MIRVKRSIGVLTAAMAALGVLAVTVVVAHEMTVKGTVAAIENTRIQVRTGDEKAGATPGWFPITSSTTVRRGDRVVKLSDAKIQPGELVVLIVDHRNDGTVATKEIRLAAPK